MTSSAIAATCAKLGLADRIGCYAIVPPQEATFAYGELRYSDERGKVEALRHLHPTLEVHYVIPSEIHSWTGEARHFAKNSLPARNIANLGWFSAAHTAIDPQIGRLLVGTQGNFGLTWGGQFSLLELFRAGGFREFSYELATTAKEAGQGVLPTLYREVAMRTMPNWMYRGHHRLRRRNPDDISRFSMLSPQFAADAGLSRQWRSMGYDPHFSMRGKSGAEFRAFHLFDANQAARDGRALYARSSGRELRDPHSDRRLLEFCLSVPEWLYRRNGIPRSFARRVLGDRLPPEILNERRRGLQAPTWFHTLSSERDLIAVDIDRFEASPLARRILDLHRMKRLLSEWPSDAQIAEKRKSEYRHALARGVHIGRFIRWVEGGNA